MLVHPDQDPPPTVTVIVMTHNDAQHVTDCIYGISAQEADFDVGLVVHDDASVDDTVAVLQGLPEVAEGAASLTAQDENQWTQGVPLPSRLALRARGEFVAFCDGDDVWTDRLKLQKQVDFMRTNPWCSIVHHRIMTIVETPSPAVEAAVETLQGMQWRSQQRVDGACLAKGNFIFSCASLIRRSALRGEVLAAGRHLEPGDWVLHALAAEQGDVGYIPEDMAAYRLYGTNAWASLSDDERDRRTDRVRWFLAGNLEGRIGEACRAEMQARLTSHVQKECNERVGAYERSLSWRLTRPLRSLRGR